MRIALIASGGVGGNLAPRTITGHTWLLSIHHSRIDPNTGSHGHRLLSGDDGDTGHAAAFRWAKTQCCWFRHCPDDRLRGSAAFSES